MQSLEILDPVQPHRPTLSGSALQDSGPPHPGPHAPPLLPSTLGHQPCSYLTSCSRTWVAPTGPLLGPHHRLTPRPRFFLPHCLLPFSGVAGRLFILLELSLPCSYD